MKFCAAIDILLTSAILAAISPSSIAFTPVKHSSRANHGSSSSLKIVVGDTVEEFEARVEATFDKANPKDPSFEAIVQAHFGGAISNQDLVTTAARLLASQGYHGENTLLATSLCCDELARQLEDDFNGIYGNNFNLGGLAGFPFAGKTGFGAMAAHIPDDGYCLVVYGPHVGVSADGTVGKVERSGIALVDTCCGSAVAASGYVDAIMSGTKPVSTSIQTFLDFQQQGVQELILPHGKRLADAENRMIELPYALYDSQDVLLTEIVQTLSTSIKRGLTMLGGIQINTGPDTPDYFVPLKFQSINYRGEVDGDMLGDLVNQAGGDLSSIGSLSDRDETDRKDDTTATEANNGVGGVDDRDEDSIESNTTSSRIQESTMTAAKSDIIPNGKRLTDEGDAGDFADIRSNIDLQPNPKSSSEAETANVLEESDIIREKSDISNDKIDTDKQKSKTIASIEERKTVVSPNDDKVEQIADTDHGDTTKKRTSDFAPSPNDKITEKMDKEMNIDGDHNKRDEPKTNIPESEGTSKEIVRDDTIISTSNNDLTVDTDKKTGGTPNATTSSDGNISDSDNQQNTKAEVAKVVTGSLESDDSEKDSGEMDDSSNSIDRARKANFPSEPKAEDKEVKDLKKESHIKDKGQDDRHEATFDEKQKSRSVGSSSIEDVASRSTTQSQSILEEDHLRNDTKENHENSRSRDILHTAALDPIKLAEPSDVNTEESEAGYNSSQKTEDVQLNDGRVIDEGGGMKIINSQDPLPLSEATVGSNPSSRMNSNLGEVDAKEAEIEMTTQNIPMDTDNTEPRNEIDSNQDKSVGDIEEDQVLSTSNENVVDETFSDTSSVVSDEGYFFTRKDDDENQVEVETDGTDMLIDEDHLSWLTTPDSQSIMNRDSIVETEVDEERMTHDEDALTADDDYDEDNVYVGDTYLLGEQIAVALENAEIDIVGVDDEDSIAPALADALLFNIERDAYDRMNEGWNQFGAESLYSIGDAGMDQFEDSFEFDDGPFTEDLLRQISIEIATKMDANDLDSSGSDSEELLLVAESIFNIINRGVRKYDEEPNDDIKTETTVDEIDRDAESDDEDDEPPTFHRYILSADRTG